MIVDISPSFFYVLVVSVGVLAAWLAGLTFWLYRVSGHSANLTKAAREGNLLEVVTGSLKEMDRLSSRLSALDDAQRETLERIGEVLKRVGLVRFDAFEDAGGELSFSAALLNDKGDGVVLTSINGRQESRGYAKPVEGGNSKYNLSKEEKEAIAKAMA